MAVKKKPKGYAQIAKELEEKGVAQTLSPKIPPGKPTIISGAKPQEGIPYIEGRGKNIKVYPEGPPAKKKKKKGFLRGLSKMMGK
jgi:hypothetical protein